MLPDRIINGNFTTFMILVIIIGFAWFWIGLSMDLFTPLVIIIKSQVLLVPDSIITRNLTTSVL